MKSKSIQPLLLKREDELSKKELIRIGRTIHRANKCMDYREEKMFKYMERLGFSIGVLHMGDYKLGKVVAIERKESDFLSIIFEGRMFRQLSELREYYEYSFLVVTKPFSELKTELIGFKTKKILKLFREGSINIQEFEDRVKKVYDYCDSLLTGLIGSLCDRGFPPIFLPNRKIGAMVIDKILMKFYDKENRSVYYNPIIEKTAEDVLISMLMLFSGVGEVKAKKILDIQYALFGRGNLMNDIENVFKNLYIIYGCYSKELADLLGFGSVYGTVEKIIKRLENVA